MHPEFPTRNVLSLFLYLSCVFSILLDWTRQISWIYTHILHDTYSLQYYWQINELKCNIELIRWLQLEKDYETKCLYELSTHPHLRTWLRILKVEYNMRRFTQLLNFTIIYMYLYEVRRRSNVIIICFIFVLDSLDRRDKMKPSVMITSPGSPDINAVYRSRSARIMQGGNSSVGGRIQVLGNICNLSLKDWDSRRTLYNSCFSFFSNLG